MGVGSFEGVYETLTPKGYTMSSTSKSLATAALAGLLSAGLMTASVAHADDATKKGAEAEKSTKM